MTDKAADICKTGGTHCLTIADGHEPICVNCGQEFPAYNEVVKQRDDAREGTMILAGCWIECVAIIETLAGQIGQKPYRELSAELQGQIQDAAVLCRETAVELNRLSAPLRTPPPPP